MTQKPKTTSTRCTEKASHSKQTLQSGTSELLLCLGWLMIGLFSLLPSQAQTKDLYAEYTQKWETVGPPKGTLMILGGSASKDNYTYFMNLVGDPNELIVFIPTAGSKVDETNTAYIRLVEAGAKNVIVLHTRDREEADTEVFAAPLRKAKAVYMGGGFQSRLAAAYLNTLTHQLMFELLERDGIVAGSSAGASIQGSFLYGGGKKQLVGFGFVKDSAVGQHYIRRNRMGSVGNRVRDNNLRFGFGVDEATAAVIRGNELEVTGEGKVAMYDPKRPGYSTQRQVYLFDGDKYDIATHKITHQTEPTPQDLWTDGGRRQWKNVNPANKWETAGPQKGKLLLYGTRKADLASLEHFVKSLDNPKDPIVVLSTGNEEMRTENQEVVTQLQKLGATQVSFLHTINSEKANSQAFAAALNNAKAVWITDSRTWQLVDAYAYTLIHKELFDVLDRNGVIGGNGFGAAIMASRLFGEPERYKWRRGYGFIKNTMVIKSPFNRRTLNNAHKVLEKNSKLQAIALTKDSKLVIEGNQAKVEGDKPVRIYKGGQEKPQIISPGESYSLN